MDLCKKGDLCKISYRFLCCFPIARIEWGKLLMLADELTWNNQSVLYENTIGHSILKKYPLSRKYQIAFLKKLIDTLESGGIEVHDQFYESFCLLMNNADNESKVDTTVVGDFSYKHYVIDGDILTMKESTNIISNGTTGLCSWQASIALAEWILNNRDQFNDQQVLELGSGAGLLGFIVAKFCSTKITVLTDCHPNVLALLEENMLINFTDTQISHKNFDYVENVDKMLSTTKNIQNTSKTSSIAIHEINWEENINIDELTQKLKPNVIVAADVIYDDTLFAPLINTIDIIFGLNSNNCKLFIASTIRNQNTYSTFLGMLKNKGFCMRVEQTPLPERLIWDDSTTIEILCVTK